MRRALSAIGKRARTFPRIAGRHVDGKIRGCGRRARQPDIALLLSHSPSVETSDRVLAPHSRCISSGRICFGYAVPPKEATQAVAAAPGRPPAPATFEPISRQLFDASGSPEERRALDFFFARTAPQLSGYFDAGFWSRLVLQFGQCEPAIRHAIMAVSAAHEQSEAGALALDASNVARGRFTLMQYNKAIARLSDQAYEGQQPSRTLLLTCLLFVCLEFLRGDTNMAMTHTLNGLNILSAWQTDVAKQRPKGHSDFQRTEEDFISENLTPIFSRLSVISTLLGKPTPIVYTTPPRMDGRESPPRLADGPFKTLNEARAALIDIQNSALRFMWASMEKKYSGTIAMTEILEQVRLEMRLAEWHRRLEELEAELSKRPKGQTTNAAREAEEDSLTILRLLYYVAHIWLSSCLSLKESAYDAFISEFQKINQLSARLLARRKPHNSFSFDTEVVGPLYFTAIKCREPATRRHTLGLLAQCDKREGAIDSRRASQLATAIMQIEEAGMQFSAEMAGPTPTPHQQHQYTTTTPPFHQHTHQQHASAPTTDYPSYNTASAASAVVPSPSSLPPEHSRVVHVVGLPTAFTDATTPPSVSGLAQAADTAARLPAEGNRVLAYYEPVMLPSAQALPHDVQRAAAGQGSNALAYRTMNGLFCKEDAFSGAGGSGEGQRLTGPDGEGEEQYGAYAPSMGYFG